METAIAEMPEADWRETMPLWAHMRWWRVRELSPEYNSFELIGFIQDEEASGYITVKSSYGVMHALSVAK